VRDRARGPLRPRIRSAVDERRSDANLKALFGIGQIPSDTRMREILDPVDPEHLRDSFGDVFRQLQRGKALEPFMFYAGGSGPKAGPRIMFPVLASTPILSC
jgi:hypothetical protein